MKTTPHSRALLVGAFMLISLCCRADESLISERLNVVATIKPLQLLAIAVGGDAVNVELLLRPNVSPHDYQLRPSDRRRLDAADVVISVGPRMEVFLQSTLSALPRSTRRVALHDNDGDPHFWLDPIAMRAAAERLEKVFGEMRPAFAQQFRTNVERLGQQLMREDELLRQQLAAVGQLRGYMVEHDAYQHFEQRYRLQHKIALTDNSDLPPTPAQIVRAKNLLDSGSVSCVWREQQESRLIKTLLAGRKVKLEVIDALAINQPASEEGLLLFYRSLGRSVLNCLRY